MDTASKTEELKIKGNEAFKTGDYTAAVSLYTSAIEVDPSNYHCLLNRSLAYLKLKRWSQAESDATNVLDIDPKNIKAFYRRAIARREKRNFAGVWEDIKLLSEAGGEASITKSELARIRGFEVAYAGVKRLGVFALQDFTLGDLIIAEAPLFSVPGLQGDVLDGLGRAAIEAAVNALAPEKKREYESLDNTHLHVLGKWGNFATNSFRMADETCGIFLQCSRFNHSCSPNAPYSWNPEINRLRIYASRDIARGDEIFVCDCAVCTQPDTSASDERRVRIKEIWESIHDFKFPPDRTLQRLLAITRGIQLLKEEGCATNDDEFTDNAAWICALHSDWESAKYWASETYKTRVAEFGEDSNLAKEAKAMLMDPKTFQLAGRGPRQTFSVRL